MHLAEGFAGVDDLFGALHAARDADDEGGLSILDHCLQCADLIKVARAGRGGGRWRRHDLVI